jgi:hypothetical protein
MRLPGLKWTKFSLAAVAMKREVEIEIEIVALFH